MPTAANVGAAQAVTIIELAPNSTTTITTAQLPARGIAFIEGGGNFTVNLPTPGIRESGLLFSIKTEHEGQETGDVFITVNHAATTLLTSYDLNQAMGSLDWRWDGYRWTYSVTDAVVVPNATYGTNTTLFAVATTEIAINLPGSSGTLALTSDFAAPPAIGNTTPAAISGTTGAFTTLTANTSLTLGTSGILSGGTNLIEQRNTTNSQEFRIFRTVSGSSDVNFERLRFYFTSDNTVIQSDSGGTGSVFRDLVLVSTQNIGFIANSFTPIRTFSGTLSSTNIGHNFNIGSATDVSIGFQVDLTAATTFRARAASPTLIRSTGGDLIFYADTGRTVLSSYTPTEIFRIRSTGIVAFSGVTSSFPALKRSSTTLQVRLADDTAFAPLACGALTLNGNLDASTRDIVTDTTTGTKIGTATTQKIGFFNATPVVQQAAVADATNGQSTQDRLNDLLARLRTLGLIAT
jgi:hypothetical protein